ncbi:MAG: CARDB domain-containing protein [Thermoplasmata archaeon]
MVRRVIAWSVALALTIGIFINPVQPVSGGGTTKSAISRYMSTPDGLYWCDDKRLTDHPSEDRIPQIVVDSTGISHVIWFRGSSYSGQYMYKKIDRLGNELISEKQIANGQIPEQYSGFQSPSIGIDSRGDFHIVFEPGGTGVAYAKYDKNGNNVVPQYNVPQGAQYPHNPSIAVSRNDLVHIIYEDYRWGYSAEGIAYAQINVDGTLIKDGVRISDPGWYCEGSTLTTDYSSNVHVTFYASNLGIFHGKLDRNGNPVPDAPPQMLYKLGTFWTHGPPYIGCDGLGGVHIIFNTAGGGTSAAGDCMYMKLNNNGVKLAAGPDENGIRLASGTCRGFPYIAGDSMGNAYAIWSDTRDGTPKIYYLKIENGHENDTNLPDRAICLTPDTAGAFEPKLAVDPDDNLHVVWKDQRDGNYEIYYKFAYNYGVELGMNPEEMYKVMYVRPNETKSANITIRNTGGLNDTVTLNMSVDMHGHTGWKVKLQATSFELKPQEIVKVKVSVTGDPEGQANDFIDTRITATSTGNPRRNSTVAFRTYLTVDERLPLSCSDKVHSTQAGVPTLYLIKALNLGDIKMDVNLTTAGPPEWEVELERSEILNLKPKEEVVFTVKVTPPATAMADEVGVVSITGKSVRNPGVKDTVVTHTVVSPSLFIELTCEEAEKWVDPGNSTAYTIFVTNYGNMPGTVIVILEIVSGTGSWIAELDANAVGVAGMETKPVTLTVVAPYDARAGERLVVRVVGFNEERTLSDDVTTTTMVNHIHRILIGINPEKQLADPGATVLFTITLQNSGNGPEEMSLSTTKLDVGWKMKFTIGGAEIISIYLDAAQTIRFEALVTVPSTALTGDHICGVGILDSSGNLWEAGLIVAVRQIYDIDLTTTLSRQLGSPGQKLFFTILTRNRGNGRDTVTFEISRLPPGWAVEFFDSDNKPTRSVTLEATVIGKTNMLVSLPLTTNTTSQELIVTGTSESGLTDSIKFVVDMMLPDLYLTGISYSPKSLVAGKAASVTVTVVNQGDVSVENVTIRLYEGGTILGTERLTRLPAGTNKTSTFTWVPREGQRTLRIVVDPDNTIIEKDETNNQVKDSIRVQGKGWELVPGFGAAVLAAALAFSLLVTRRRR